MVPNLALFCLATVLVTFQKIGRFFPNHLVTLIPLNHKTYYKLSILVTYCITIKLIQIKV